MEGVGWQVQPGLVGTGPSPDYGVEPRAVEPRKGCLWY